MREIIIGGKRIADDTAAYVIGELGHNHGGSFETARSMIQMCAAAGVDAVKLQKRDIDTLYSPELLAEPYISENSFGATYGAHRHALEFGMADYIAVRAVARTAGVHFFATAFDEPSVEFLVKVDVPAIKLASSAVTDTQLLDYASRWEIPVILSTGGATVPDIDKAVDILSKSSAPFALLHCTAAYPMLDVSQANLRMILTLRNRYPGIVIGWSGHDPGVSLALVAYALGARIIEKHVTLNRASKGTDHSFSLEPKGVAQLCEDLKKTHVACGDGIKRIYPSELGPLAKMRRRETDQGLRITGAKDVCHLLNHSSRVN